MGLGWRLGQDLQPRDQVEVGVAAALPRGHRVANLGALLLRRRAGRPGARDALAPRDLVGARARVRVRVGLTLTLNPP